MHLLEQATQPSDPSYRLIPLTQGQFAKVDPEDYDYLIRWKWYAMWSPDTQSFYAVRGVNVNGNTRHIRMHRVVCGAPRGVLVDHKDRDTLNNTRGNLRQATQSQNHVNSKRRTDNTSGFRGVSLTGNNRWRAYINFNKKQVHLGFFDSPEKAAEAHVKASHEMFGEFTNV